MADLKNHLRNCIRDELKLCLQGCKYLNVYCGQLERYCSADHVSQKKGAVNIRLGDESAAQRSRGIGSCNGTTTMNLQIILEVYAIGCEDVEYFVDSLCSEVQAKMCECHGTCNQFDYVGTEPTRIDIGDQTYHLCRIFYNTKYAASPCDMSLQVAK